MAVLDEVRANLISNYDNNYRQLEVPYHYQNIDIGKINYLSNVFATRLSTAISIAESNNLGVPVNTNTNWLKISNTEAAPVSYDLETENEKLFDFTIEKEYLDYYTNLITTQYQVGNRTIINGIESIDNTTETNLETYSIPYSWSGDEFKIFPQREIVWNSQLQKFVMIWYTPVSLDGKILPYDEVRLYLNSLYNCYDYLYSDYLDKRIILKVDYELGFDIMDTYKLSIYLNKQLPEEEQITFSDLPTKVQQAYSKGDFWCKDLLNILFKYKTFKEKILENFINYPINYFFIDENINLFERVNNSYFIFEVKDNYYEDIISTSALSHWQAGKAYKQGECVIRDIEMLSENTTLQKKIIYKCLLNLEAQDEFIETCVKTNSDGTTEELLAWELLTGELGNEEIYIINSIDENFNADDYYRFVFPNIEKQADAIILPNGLLKENEYSGNFAIAAKDISESEAKDIDCIVLYTSIIDDKIVYSHSDIDYQTNSKVICYIKKAKRLLVPINIQFNPESSSIEIPAETFYNRQDLIKCMLGSNITRIGNEAFYNCSNLKHCILPVNLRILGLRCFASCRSLVRANLPEGVTSLEGTYSGCENLKTVVLSKNTTELGNFTFKNCKKLLKVYNTQNIRILGRGVFSDCTNLIEFTLPPRVTEISDELFKNCLSLHFNIGDNRITYIGTSSFENCEQLTEIISFEHLRELKPRTYKGCTKIKEVTFDFKNFNSGNKIIPESFFQDCLNLKYIYWAAPQENEELEDLEDTYGPTELRASCFRNCGSLVEIRIPQTVKRIGIYAFYDCLKLREITVPKKFGADENSDWLENIELYEGRVNKDNWVNLSTTKVIRRE